MLTTPTLVECCARRYVSLVAAGLRPAVAALPRSFRPTLRRSPPVPAGPGPFRWRLAGSTSDVRGRPGVELADRAPGAGARGTLGRCGPDRSCRRDAGAVPWS